MQAPSIMSISFSGKCTRRQSRERRAKAYLSLDLGLIGHDFYAIFQCSHHRLVCTRGEGDLGLRLYRDPKKILGGGGRRAAGSDEYDADEDWV